MSPAPGNHENERATNALRLIRARLKDFFARSFSALSIGTFSASLRCPGRQISGLKKSWRATGRRKRVEVSIDPYPPVPRNSGILTSVLFLNYLFLTSAKFLKACRPQRQRAATFVPVPSARSSCKPKTFCAFLEALRKTGRASSEYLYLSRKSASKRAARVRELYSGRHSQRSLPIESSMRNRVI